MNTILFYTTLAIIVAVALLVLILLVGPLIGRARRELEEVEPPVREDVDHV